MNKKTNRIIYATMLFIASFANVNAGCSDPYCYDPYEKNPYCFECQQNCDSDCHLYFGAEGLYWTVYDNDLDYAVDFDSLQATILGPRKTHFSSYDWNWGVRGWMGWNWCCGWDAKAAYTYYETDGKNYVDTQEEDVILKASLLHPATGLSDAEKATSYTDLRYQTVDLLFGRVVCFCQNTLVLHPYMGVRGMWLKQKQKTIYEGGDFVLDPIDFIGGSLAVPARVTWESDIASVGLHAGFDINFRTSTGFGLYGSLAGSLLAAKSDNKHLQETLDSDEEVNSTEVSVKEEQCQVIPGLHLTAGIQYDICCENCLFFRLKAGYEFNDYFDTPHLRRYHYNNDGVSNSSTAGNVALHGLTVGAELYF